MVAVAGVEPADEARDEMLVLGALVEGLQRRRGELPLAWVQLSVLGRGGAPLLIVPDLILEQGEVEGLQRVGAQPVLVEVLAVADELIALEQIRDLAEAGRVDAEGAEGLEEDEDFKGRVKDSVCIHPPWLSKADFVVVEKRWLD